MKSLSLLLDALLHGAGDHGWVTIMRREGADYLVRVAVPSHFHEYTGVGATLPEAVRGAARELRAAFLERGQNASGALAELDAALTSAAMVKR